jgi:hypothetical protein
MKSLLMGIGRYLCKVYNYHDSQGCGYKRSEILSRLDGTIWMGYGSWCSLCGNFVILCAPFVDHTLWYTCGTPDFKIETRCSSYVCPGSSCHTYGQNGNIENQCLYYINFISWLLSLQRRLYRLSHRAAVENSNPIGNLPGATQASSRNLDCKISYHL